MISVIIAFIILVSVMTMYTLFLGSEHLSGAFDGFILPALAAISVVLFVLCITLGMYHIGGI